jgi:hypothetical protein
MDVVVDRDTSTYEVRAKARENGAEKVLTGKIDLPNDAYNGMIVTTLSEPAERCQRNRERLGLRAEPTAIALELAFVGEQVIRVGDQSRKAWQYAFKPDIGPVKKLLGDHAGQVAGRFPLRLLCPGRRGAEFVRFEGPLQFMGPILSIELISPQVAPKAEDRKHAPTGRDVVAMNPLFSLLIKQLPKLLPLVKAMMEKPARGQTEDGQLAEVEQSVEWLAERSDAVEKNSDD